MTTNGNRRTRAKKETQTIRRYNRPRTSPEADASERRHPVRESRASLRHVLHLCSVLLRLTSPTNNFDRSARSFDVSSPNRSDSSSFRRRRDWRGTQQRIHRRPTPVTGPHADRRFVARSFSDPAFALPAGLRPWTARRRRTFLERPRPRACCRRRWPVARSDRLVSVVGASCPPTWNRRRAARRLRPRRLWPLSESLSPGTKQAEKPPFENEFDW